MTGVTDVTTRQNPFQRVAMGEKSGEREGEREGEGEEEEEREGADDKRESEGERQGEREGEGDREGESERGFPFRPPLPRSLAINGRMRGAISAVGGVCRFVGEGGEVRSGRLTDDVADSLSQEEYGRKRKIPLISRTEQNNFAEWKKQRGGEEGGGGGGGGGEGGEGGGGEVWRSPSTSVFASLFSQDQFPRDSFGSPGLQYGNSSGNGGGRGEERERERSSITYNPFGCRFAGNGVENVTGTRTETGTDNGTSTGNSVGSDSQPGRLKRMREGFRKDGNFDEGSDGCEGDDEDEGGRRGRGGPGQGKEKKSLVSEIYGHRMDVLKHRRKVGKGSPRGVVGIGEVVDAENVGEEGESDGVAQKKDGREFRFETRLQFEGKGDSFGKESEAKTGEANFLGIGNNKDRLVGTLNQTTIGLRRGREGESDVLTKGGEDGKEDISRRSKIQLRRVDSDGGLKSRQWFGGMEGGGRGNGQNDWKTLRRVGSDGTKKGLYEQYRKMPGEEDEDFDEETEEDCSFQQTGISDFMSLQDSLWENDNDEDGNGSSVEPEGSNLKFILSSGREGKNSDISCVRKPTIGDEFESYFSQLVLGSGAL